MIHRSGQTCQVGFNVSSTLQEHSISVLTKCRAKLWIQVVPRKTFSPWAISPGRFLLYLDIRVKIPFDPNIIYICHIKPAAPHSAESAQRHSAPLYWPTHSSEIYLFSGAFAGVVVTLSAWKSALFRKISLSEPHPRRVWDFSERF